MHTIDFIIQYKLLTNPLILLKSFGTVYKKMFGTLKGQINKKQLDSLHDAFLFIKKLEMANQIIFNGSQSIIADAKDKKEIISQFLGMKFPEELNAKISLVFKNNFTSFNSLVGE